MVCFTKLTPRTPPSVIHGWKATDLLYEMVKRKNYLLNPISRQNFADALAENHNLKLEVCHTKCHIGWELHHGALGGLVDWIGWLSWCGMR